MSLGVGRVPRLVEFQAVILACAEEGLGLFPLTNEDQCTSLLPIANRPLLSYQLNLLDKAKFSSVIVVTFKSFERKIRRCINSLFEPNSQVGLKLQTQSDHKMNVDLIALDEEKVQGTVDVLRQIKHKLFTDFILISGDLVTEASIHHLADVHRIRDATVTILLKEQTQEDIKKYQKEHKNNELMNYFGIVRDKKNKRARHSRLVYRKSALADEGLAVPKSLLTREPAIELRTDLFDTHLYVFRNWVLDLLSDEKHSKMASIQSDFIPYLIKMQYRDPALLIPKKILEVVRKKRLELSNSMSASQRNIPALNDIVRCFAFIVSSSESYCRRADTIQTYATMNHEIAVLPVAATTPWESPKSLSGLTYTSSVIGRGCEFGENINLKDCIIGNHCKILPGAKLNRCVLMDSVTVGANSTVQNTVLCHNSIIEDNCKVNNCQVAENGRVSKSSRLVNEAVLQEEN